MVLSSSSSSSHRGKSSSSSSSWDDEYATSLRERRVGGHHHHHHHKCFSSSSSNANALGGHAVFDEEENSVKVVEDDTKSNNNNNNKKIFTSSNNNNVDYDDDDDDDETETSTQKGVGSVHLILGPMFAGKTTHLLDRVRRLEESAAANVLLLKSDKDTRYARNKVVTHDGRGRECFPVTSLEVDVVVNAVGEKKWRECDVVAVDEAQFLTNLYEFCRVAADEHDKIVLVAGLNGDFKRETFGEVQETLPLCDSVTKLTAKCKCGRPALFSKRIVNAGDGQELVGGADKYLPACRRCFLN